MKIATYNVNGINGRLPVLLRWLKESRPDIVCLQELKAPQEKFPEKPIRDLGYDAIWHGEKSWNGVAILSRVGQIHETRRGLPGDLDDSHSRYIEAAINGILIGGLYLPNGNPKPGPKFDYKLRWFERLIAHAADLLSSGQPVMLAGDFNVMPTDLDVYKPERWLDDALFAPEARAAYFRLLDQGWTDALRTLHPNEQIYTFWDYFRNAFARNAGLRIDHLLLSPLVADCLVDAEVDVAVRGWEKSSDHAPVWIELADKAGRRPRFAPRQAGYQTKGGPDPPRTPYGGTLGPFYEAGPTAPPLRPTARPDACIHPSRRISSPAKGHCDARQARGSNAEIASLAMTQNKEDARADQAPQQARRRRDRRYRPR